MHENRIKPSDFCHLFFLATVDVLSLFLNICTYAWVLGLVNWLKALNVARKLTLIFWLESDTANWHMMDSAMNVQKESKFLLYLAARILVTKYHFFAFFDSFSLLQEKKCCTNNFKGIFFAFSDSFFLLLVSSTAGRWIVSQGATFW